MVKLYFLEGDEEVIIPLSNINQLYIGFDPVFSAASVKSFGMMWQPLRISYGGDQNIYLIIDFNLFTSNNNRFSAVLKEMLF